MNSGLKMADLEQVGVIHSPYKKKEDAPFQGRHHLGVSTIEIFDRYVAALMDIDRCSHLYVLYWQDKGDREVLQTKTPWGPDLHGVFSTRSPNRPNPIGLCVVDLIDQKGRFLEVSGLDALDGSPLIDIKPYSASIDAVSNARIGWSQDGDPS